jgi:hypothetical protein
MGCCASANYDDGDYQVGHLVTLNCSKFICGLRYNFVAHSTLCSRFNNDSELHYRDGRSFLLWFLGAPSSPLATRANGVTHRQNKNQSRDFMISY